MGHQVDSNYLVVAKEEKARQERGLKVSETDAP